MKEHSNYSTDLSQMAGLIRQVANDRVELSNGELNDILQEELDQTLADKARFVSHASERSTQSICWKRGSDATIRQVLEDPNPPIDALNVIKEYAKHVRNDPDSVIPKNVCSAIYYVAIAAADARHARAISSQHSDSIHKGFQWALAQPWIPPSLQELVRSALDRAA